MAIRKPYKSDSDRFIFSVNNISLGAGDMFCAPKTGVVCYTSWLARKRPLCLPASMDHKYKLLLEIASG